MNEIVYQVGLPRHLKSEAAILYDEAFGKKLSVAVKSENKRVALIQRSLRSEFAIVAISENKLLGIAGFHTENGSLTNGITYKNLLSELGFIKGNWAAIIFSFYERKPKKSELLMDGIVVHTDSRGKGIGSKLLEKVADYAQENHFKSVRLDVIDTNPKAKVLYKRKGFVVVKTEYYPYLKRFLGFSGSTTMALTLSK
ncbi:GNAT family N-acetyltransferase [Thalassotalea hakodatensis]|uniref:GNAT family N-acetyltransferase n=1 Tax=Thalassotalea hakodatensis TaxID=3030492 RepID=UPI0025747151|nr:GNAT family N-acetyltransferase [Thalassotalea hakodatensis]